MVKGGDPPQDAQLNVSALRNVNFALPSFPKPVFSRRNWQLGGEITTEKPASEEWGAKPKVGVD